MKQKKFVEVVINRCWGGFGLSDAAYKWLIKKGVPVRTYIKDAQDELNAGEVIFDRTKEEYTMSSVSKSEYIHMMGRYWDTWTGDNRTHPLVVGVVKALGEKASARLSHLTIVKVPADAKWKIDDYDGMESVEEEHRSWT